MDTTQRNTNGARTTDQDGTSAPRVVHAGNDGIWLNFNPVAHCGMRGGSMQHLRGITGRRGGQTGTIGSRNIGDQQCVVHRKKARPGRFEVVVMNPDGVRPFLLSATGKLCAGLGYGGLNVHVHAPLIERLGQEVAVANARQWANQFMLCLPSPRDVVACERVSRIDFCVDVLVEKGGPDDNGPDVHKQLKSRLQHPERFWDTGWEIGRGETEKDRLRLVIVSYDKLKERRDKAGLPGLREYVTGLNDASLVVQPDGPVVDRDTEKEMRVWRIEFRFHRSFLCTSGIDDAVEAIAALPSLVAAASQNTRLHQRGSNGSVLSTNPLTRVWRCLEETVM